eukprot:scaffold675023_cov84-Prasinocladus_malaysianus.AAC.1
MSIDIASSLAPELDDEGCPKEVQPFPMAEIVLERLSSLWELGFKKWSDVLYALPNKRLRVLTIEE